MVNKITLDANGVVVKRQNLPTLPKLVLKPIGQESKKLRRLHNLLSNSSPKICIHRGEGIGDVIMTTPTVRFLAEQYPTAEITYATNLRYLDGALPAVLKNNPYIDHIIDWESINKDDFDVIVDLHCPCVGHEISGARPINRIDLFATHIGAELKNPVPVYNTTEDEDSYAAQFIQQNLKLKATEKLIVLSPFASNIYRSIDPKITRDLLKLFQENRNFKLLLLTHDSDYTQNINFKDFVHYVGNNLKVREVAALIKRADLLICPDSAALHLAGALGTPTIGLFGPTDARARVNHYHNSIGIWPGGKLRCAPCWYSSHLCNHQSCWKYIQAKQVHQVSVDILVKGFARDKEARGSSELITRGIINTEIL